MMRTRVPRWTPGFLQSLRRALRPALASLVVWGGGYIFAMEPEAA